MKLQQTVTGNKMQDLSFVSENYSKRKPKDYRLSISIRRDGFSFLIVHKDVVMAYAYTTNSSSDRVTAFKNFLNQEILQQKFSAVSIIVVTPKFTLVPKKFYDESMLLSYATMNFTKAEDESIIDYQSVTDDSVVLFPIETDLWTLCRVAYKDQEMISYVPHVAPILEANIRSKKPKMHISVENTFCSAVLIKDKKLQFANSFLFRNVNDFVYFVMNTFTQLHLDPLQVEVELSGKIGPKSPYFSALTTFVKNVTMAPSVVKAEKFPYTLFYNNCNVALCE